MNYEIKNKREIRRLTIRNNILAIAEEEFLENGFRLTNMDEIADKASVTKRTLYKYFPSKIALFIQMFDIHLKNLEMILKKNIATDDKAVTVLKKNFRSLFEYTKKNARFMRLYWMIDSKEFEGEIPKELTQRVSTMTKQMLMISKPAVDKAIDEGSIFDEDSILLVHLMSAINKGIFIHTNKEKRFEIADIDPEKLFDVVISIFERGLFKTNE